MVDDDILDEDNRVLSSSTRVELTGGGEASWAFCIQKKLYHSADGLGRTDSQILSNSTFKHEEEPTSGLQRLVEGHDIGVERFCLLRHLQAEKPSAWNLLYNGWINSPNSRRLPPRSRIRYTIE